MATRGAITAIRRVYDDGDLVVRPDDYLAFADGKMLALPRRVLFLLFELADRPGVVRTRADLATGAWGPMSRDLKLQSVDQAVSRLRQALAAALPGLAYVHTHPGLGYRFQRELRTERAQYTNID
jgi:DNA-binding response OmpR family regulator